MNTTKKIPNKEPGCWLFEAEVPKENGAVVVVANDVVVSEDPNPKPVFVAENNRCSGTHNDQIGSNNLILTVRIKSQRISKVSDFLESATTAWVSQRRHTLGKIMYWLNHYYSLMITD